MPLKPSTEKVESPKLSDMEQRIHNAFLAMPNNPETRKLFMSPPLPLEQRSNKPYNHQEYSKELAQLLVDNLNRNTAEKD